MRCLLAIVLALTLVGCGGERPPIDSAAQRERLVARLRENNADARLLIAEDLERLGEGAVPLLVEYIEKEQPQKCYEAVGALCRIKSKQRVAAVQALIRLMKHGNLELQDLIVQTLRSIGPPARDAVPELQRVLRERKRPACRSAPLALVSVQGAEAVPFLIEALAASKMPDDIIDVADALGCLGASARSAVPALEALLQQDKDTFVQKALGRALTRMN
jgi:HEAT repeat protein